MFLSIRFWKTHRNGNAFFFSVASRGHFCSVLCIFKVISAIPRLFLAAKGPSLLPPPALPTDTLSWNCVLSRISYILHSAMKKESPQTAVCDRVTSVNLPIPHTLSNTTQNCFEKMETRASKMAQWVRVLAVPSPGHISTRKESTPKNCPDLHTCTVVHTGTHIEINKSNRTWKMNSQCEIVKSVERRHKLRGSSPEMCQSTDLTSIYKVQNSVTHHEMCRQINKPGDRGPEQKRELSQKKLALWWTRCELKRKDFKIKQSVWSSNYSIFIKDKATSM